MTDEAALIAAYADQPDEAHRLVLADWFDERDPRGGWPRSWGRVSSIRQSG